MTLSSLMADMAERRSEPFDEPISVSVAPASTPRRQVTEREEVVRELRDMAKRHRKGLRHISAAFLDRAADLIPFKPTREIYMTNDEIKTTLAFRGAAALLDEYDAAREVAVRILQHVSRLQGAPVPEVYAQQNALQILRNAEGALRSLRDEK